MRGPSPTRRELLAALGTGATATGLAGCTGYVGGDTRTPTATATATPEASDELESWSRYGPDWEAPTDSPLQGVSFEPIVTKLKVPWDFAFAPNDDLFVTERVGRILRVENGVADVVAEPEAVVDASAIDPGDEGGWWSTGGEDGLLGVAVHPAYPDQPYVYAYYTYRDEEAPAGQYNRVVRYDVTAEDVAGTEEIVVDEIPAEQYHNGGRLAFGPRDYLWVTCGDGGQPEKSTDPSFLGGKVLRVQPSGEAAPENPEWDGGDPRVFTIGHRNPQGVTWLPDGTPVVTEHGPGGRDEVNVLEAGANYGWPDARRADGYRGTDFHRPVVNTGNRTWAPTGCVFYTGDAVPAWRNRLMIGALRGQHVNAVTLSPPETDLPPMDGGDARRFDADWLDPRFVATSHKLFRNELGRVRCIGQGPDGNAYGITSNRDGRAEGEAFPREEDDVLVRFVQN
ncbi:PQQ-dependent sugar dehydrogenase [Salinirubellus sp. GCM10025818]|uniref:PQQ-dependent sugar dehydrogenase n=1 Tax=Salinirubellus TaxID=2162630 RepID=UPI0030CDFABC